MTTLKRKEDVAQVADTSVRLALENLDQCVARLRLALDVDDGSSDGHYALDAVENNLAVLRHFL